ncbi:DUF6048 family protein [Limibacter armeniacum]|uniref:DUF6048 family protein n=1 Tax=Limibacter armeniacum TaxID=466084 RepID=UPI002FE5FE35
MSISFSSKILPIIWGIFFFSFSVSAQVTPSTPEAKQPVQDSLKVPKVTYEGFLGKNGVILSGVRFGTDVLALSQSFLDDDLDKYSFYGDLMIKNKYFITMEYGYQDRTRRGDFSFSEDNIQPFSYRSEGTFWRFGVEYNLIHKQTVHNAVYAGLKYGVATFDQEATYYSLGSDYWEISPELQGFSEQGLRVSWLQMMFGLKVRLFGGLYSDVNASISIPSSFGSPVITQNDIPGFGFNKDNNVKIIYQYRLIYKIPLWKVPIDIPKELDPDE